MNLDQYIDSFSSYSQNQDWMSALTYELYQRHLHHYVLSSEYRRISDTWFSNIDSHNLSTFPFIPVSLFKKFDLLSIEDSEIFRVLRSSGTSGQEPSKIYLDKFNSRSQSRALSKLFSGNTGLYRPNILILDSPSVVDPSSTYTARRAGIVGFSSLCRKAFFALNPDYSINMSSIYQAVNSSQTLLVYGFTFIIWQYVLSTCVLPTDIRKFLAKNAVLLHGGGWKKLTDVQLTTANFNSIIFEKLGITSVYNYYGMVEQTGSIFFECSAGFLHTNYFAHIIGRDLSTLRPSVHRGIPLLCQVLSSLPTSYPGHSILTDDIITLYHIDDCPCGKLGHAFLVNGRLPKSEPRGCSDTFTR